MTQPIQLWDEKQQWSEAGTVPSAYKILELPKEHFDFVAVLSSLFRLQVSVAEFQHVRRWLEVNFHRLNSENATMTDQTTFRWNQGAIQILADLFQIIDSSRKLIETHEGGKKS